MSEDIQTWWWFRHAPPINPFGLCYGEIETDLVSPEVCARLEELARILPGDEAVWLSSTLSRTFNAASEVKRLKGGRFDILPDRVLAEQSFGDWSMKRLSSLKNDPLFQAYMKDPSTVRPPNGENLTDVYGRVSAGTDKWVRQHIDADHIVSGGHAGTIRAHMARVLKRDMEYVLKAYKIPFLGGIKTYYDRDTRDWLPRIDRF